MEYLKIENFKCFNDIEIPLNKLTVFAGANGNGKSTVLQSILFLRRSIEHCSTWLGGNVSRYSFVEINGLNVELNGAYCLSLGNSLEILPKNSRSSCIQFGMRSESERFGVSFESVSETPLSLTPVAIDNEEYHGMYLNSLFKQEFYYLNAERIGPRIKQDISFFDYPNTGYKGENVAQLLGDTNFTYTFKVEESRRNSNSKSARLEQQVNAWLDFIMPGVSVSASYDINTLSAQIKINNAYTAGESVISTNIGFGISYLLPIIVSGLIAQNDSYLVIENPEAHLHPSAQSRVARFLSVMASSGVKVIVETHSDHFINGMQISAAMKEIPNNDITINFLSEDKETFQPNLKSISINEKGDLSIWPEGFFDQSQRDFAHLFNLRNPE